MISGVTTSTRFCAPVRTRLKATCSAGRRRRAAEPHVEGRALRAERMLDLDGDRRIGPLVVRGRADHHVDVGGREPGIVERAPAPTSTPNSAIDRELVVVARRNARRHALGVENAVEHQHVAVLDARRIDDELGVRFLQQRLAATPARRAFSVSTQALKLATSSSLVIEASGISTPMPVMAARYMRCCCPVSPPLRAARCDLGRHAALQRFMSV